MTTAPSIRPEPSGFPTLLIIMAGLVGAAAVAIAAFVEIAKWWALVVAMGAFMGGAALVLVAIARTIDRANAEDMAEEAALAAAAQGETRDRHAARRRPQYAPQRRATRA